MKKAFLTILSVVASLGIASAQDLKFGHINMQEVVFLMDEMDSARVQLDKYNKEIQDTYQAMATEYQEKINTYQQMGANWSPAVLQAKEQEIRDIEARLQQYQATAQNDMQAMQQQLIAPIQKKANEAVAKVAKANGLIYVFDISMGSVPYYSETLSQDITAQVKAELKIRADKKLPQQGTGM